MEVDQSLLNFYMISDQKLLYEILVLFEKQTFLLPLLTSQSS